MTFQIFVGGQRVNSAEILDTPGWSAQDKSRKRDCNEDEDAVAYVSRKRPVGPEGAVLSRVTNALGK